MGGPQIKYLQAVEGFIGQFNEESKRMELDIMDRKIMYLLSINARFAESSMAKALKISKEVVHYRLKRLQKDGFLHGFITVLDAEKMGQIVHTINLSLHPFHEHKSMIKQLIGDARIINLKHFDSQLDLQFSVATSTIHEFAEFFDSFLKEHHQLIKDYSHSTLLEEHFTGLNFLLEPAERPKILERKGSSFQHLFSARKMLPGAAAVDAKDVAILAELKINSRMPILQLAQKVHLATTSVQGRISRMIQQGIIKNFIPYASFSFLGYQWYMLFLRTKNLNQATFFQYLHQHPQTVWVSKRLGKWNYQVSIFARNNTQFNQVVQDLQQHFHDSIINYDSATVYKQYKYESRVEIGTKIP